MKYKKYFYVLRPLLACKWIEEKKCPPPVLFDELVIEEKLSYYKASIASMADDRNPDWEPLETEFRKLVLG